MTRRSCLSFCDFKLQTEFFLLAEEKLIALIQISNYKSYKDSDEYEFTYESIQFVFLSCRLFKSISLLFYQAEIQESISFSFILQLVIP